jgi:AraC-like DNA-binding protein
MYLLQGKATVMLDFQEYRHSRAAAFFITPGQVHTVKPQPGLHGFTISFTQAFFDDDTPPPSRLLELPFFFSADAHPRLPLGAAQVPEIAALFQNLHDEYNRALPDAAEILRATLRLLLLQLARLYVRVTPEREPTRGQILLRQFHGALEKHFREETTLDAYARLMGITCNHLNDVIREQTGHSAGDLIRKRRLLDAKRMLSHSNLSVSEVGYQLGFKDPSYFSRFFRRYEGVTPVEFVTQFREKYH